MKAYSKALAESESFKTALRGNPGTFSRLISDYYQSVEFKKLKDSTKKTYKNIMERFSEEHGHRRVDQLKREHISAIIGGMSDRPGAAKSLLNRLKILIMFAIDRGIITTDPTYKMRTYKSGEFHTWTEEEIGIFENYWGIGTKQRLAFALHLYTGQRRSDVHRMTWRDIEKGFIRVTQQKTGTKLQIPLHPTLQDVLSSYSKNHIAIIVTEYGTPFTVAGYGNFMGQAIRDAGLPTQCKLHGLRKAASRRLAESGCTSLEIASITGHRTLSEIERYTRAASQEILSVSAIRKQSENN